MALHNPKNINNNSCLYLAATRFISTFYLSDLSSKEIDTHYICYFSRLNMKYLYLFILVFSKRVFYCTEF